MMLPQPTHAMIRVGVQAWQDSGSIIEVWRAMELERQKGAMMSERQPIEEPTGPPPVEPEPEDDQDEPDEPRPAA